MNRSLRVGFVAFVWVVCGIAVAEDHSRSGNTTVLQSPIRLRVSDQFIDTGAAWGHSSPCIADLDSDGLDDLIVGDYGGKFQWFRNVGTKIEPKYAMREQATSNVAAPPKPTTWFGRITEYWNPSSKLPGRVQERLGELIQAGGVDAEVHIYCCIGAQARFCDLDGDGLNDMIANSYDPGHCYLFRGLPNNKFAAREELLDKSSTPIRSSPIQKQNYQSFGSFFEPVDWDNDGDFDLLIGCFEGSLKLRINEGTSKNPDFAIENIVVETSGEPLRVKGHLCPVVADWDGDGLWDIVAGSEDGSVTWFQNIGNKLSPKFSAGQELVAANTGSGYNLLLWSDAEIVPGIRSQVEVTDYNHDGKLDLIVGDFYTAYDVKSDLTDSQKKEVLRLISEDNATTKAFTDKLAALRKDFALRFPGDEVFNEKAEREWKEEYQALKTSPEYQRMVEDEKSLGKNLRPFLNSTRGDGNESHQLAQSHGHVWLFTRD